MSPDQINAMFECAGSVLVWLNVRQVVKDEGFLGVHPAAVGFFFSWGVFNLFYYPWLHQPLSFIGGMSMVAANSAWVGVMLWYGRRKP